MTTLGRDTAKAFLSNCRPNSLWFERFCKGCFKRMGQEAHQNLAISVKVMLALLALLDREWEAAEQQARQSLAMIGAYACIAYGGSFRGDEVFHTDLCELLKHSTTPLIENKLPYVLIPLLGRFKNEDGEHYHLIPLAFETRSGIEIGKWVERLVQVKKSHRQTGGPAFSNQSGRHISQHWMEMEILDRQHQVQIENPEVIPNDINVYEEYGISRSFQRGASTQARNQCVDENDINLINRWRTVENAKGCKPKLQMQDHYSEI